MDKVARAPAPSSEATRVQWGREMLASVVVFLVALPLCMGIAIASGAPPALGLITGIVGGLVVGFVQGAPLQVSGPAAGLAIITLGILEKKGVAGLGIAVLGAGILQMIAGLARGGRWFRAVPPSVIHGMLGGIGVLILSSQFHVMVDDTPKGSGLNNLLYLPQAIVKGVTISDLPHEEAAFTGVFTIVALVAWNRWAPRVLAPIPGALVGVLAGSLVAGLLDFPIAHVSLPASLTSAITLPSAASVQLFSQGSTWLDIVTVAVVASAETMLCASAVDRMHSGPRTNYNRELFAQGIGNAVCGALGALPMTGVIVRSSANAQAGGKTRASAILHGVWILMAVLLLPFVLRLVPVASLAAVLVFTGYKLVNPGIVKELRKYGKTEVVVYVVTIVGIVSTDLLKGVLIGLALSVGKLLFSLSNLEIAVEDDPSRRRTLLHLRGSATFLRLPDLAEVLEAVPSDRELHVRFDELEYLDHAVLEMLLSWERQHKSKGGDVIVDWSAINERYQLGKQPRASVSDDPTHGALSRPPVLERERERVRSDVPELVRESHA